jgi:hypothetical protein
MRAAFALVGVLVAGASSADEPPALAHLLAQTGKYIRGLQQDFATVIRSTKRSRARPPTPTTAASKPPRAF